MATTDQNIKSLNLPVDVLTGCSGRHKGQNHQRQCLSRHPVSGCVFPLSEPRASPKRPEPQHSSQKRLSPLSFIEDLRPELP